jgi:uncharacterized protein GlcG (DUF336 family)
MAANSASLAKSAEQNTGKTGSLTPAQALEILQESVRRCQQSGIGVTIAPVDREQRKLVVIVLANVDLVAGNFVLANTGKVVMIPEN